VTARTDEPQNFEPLGPLYRRHVENALDVSILINLSTRWRTLANHDDPSRNLGPFPPFPPVLTLFVSAIPGKSVTQAKPQAQASRSGERAVIRTEKGLSGRKGTRATNTGRETTVIRWRVVGGGEKRQ
jgi:hypothetical protein